MKFVPELEEEQFQSMVAVPVLSPRDGDVIGVVVLHTEAPREFDDGVLNFLVHTASLVAGAIENAKLYEGTRRRVDALTTLTQLSQALAAVTLREDLYDAVTRGARQLLGADSCQIWRIDPDADELDLAGSDPPDGSRPPRARGAADGADARRPQRRGGGRAAARAARGGRRAARAPLLHGARARVRRRGRGAAARRRAPDRGGPEEGRADRAAHRREHRQGHVRGAGRGSVEAAEAKAAEARCDLSRPHVFLHAVRAPDAGERAAWPEVAARFEARLRRLYPRRSSTRATTACARSPRSRPPTPRRSSGCARAARSWRGGGRGGRPQRRGPRRGERAPPDARGRGRRADRPLACGRRRRGAVRGARRLQVPGPPRARRRAA